MAGRISVGSVSVSIVPSAEGFPEKVRAIVEDASKDDVRIKVDADTAEADAKIDETRARADSLNGSFGGLSGGIGGLGAAITLALPLLPELSAGLVAVGGAFAAALAGAGSFGAVALTDITNATNATQKLQAAQTAVNDATTTQARTDALIKQQALIASLGPNTIALGGAITDLGNAWKGFTAAFTPEVTRDVESFANILTTAFPLIQPLVAAGAGAVSTILTNLDTALQSPAAQQFFSWLAGTAEQDILGLTNALGGFGAGIGEVFKDFAPIETLVVNGLSAMGSAFDKWATNLSGSQGFQSFLRYVATNGPLLTKTFADVASAFGKILETLTPLLPPLLQLIDHIATLITQHQPIADMLAAVLAGLVAFKVISTVVGWFTTLGDAVYALNLKLVTLRDSEIAAGETVNVTPIVASLGEIEVAADAAKLSLGGLLGLLGVSVLTAAVGVWADYYGSKAAGDTNLNTDIATGNGGQPLPDLRPGSSQSITDLYEAAGGGTVGLNLDNAEMEDFINQAGTPAQKQALANLLQASSYPKGVPLPPFYLAKPGQPSQTKPIDINDPIYQSTAADLQNTLNDQVPGLPTSFTQPDPNAGLGSGAGSPTLPLTPKAQSAAVTAAINNAQGIAALLGLNIIGSLAQGIATGANPLTEAFQNINLKLTGPAQTLGTALQNIFTSALSYGQQAAASLAFSVTGPNLVGTQTNVTVGANGQLMSTVQSQLVGNATQTYLTDSKWVADLQKATALGLSPSLKAQFVQAGPSALATLDALVNSGSSAIGQLNQVNSQIDALGNQYGLQTASDKYLPLIHQDLQDIAAIGAKAPAATGKHVAANIAKPATAGARSAGLRNGLGAASSSINHRRS